MFKEYQIHPLLQQREKRAIPVFCHKIIRIHPSHIRSLRTLQNQISCPTHTTMRRKNDVQVVIPPAHFFQNLQAAICASVIHTDDLYPVINLR